MGIIPNSEEEKMVVTPEEGSVGVGERPVQEKGDAMDAGQLKEQHAETEGKTYQEFLQKVQSTVTTSSMAQTVSSDVGQLAHLEEKVKVERLLGIALDKGPEYAFRVALQLDDMYAVDVLRDTLANKLFSQLVEKGLVSEQ